MIDDKKACLALLEIISKHELRGKEAPALVALMNWIHGLEKRLKPEVKPKPVSKKKVTKKKA